MPGNYIEDTYELKTIVVEDSPYLPSAKPVSEVDDEVMAILDNKTKTIVVDLELMYLFDPSMSEGEMATELENIELPHGYKEDSFKLKRFRQNGKDDNDVQKETSAIVGVQVEFVFPKGETYKDLRYFIDVFCKNNIKPRYKIISLTDTNGNAITKSDDKQAYNVEKSFSDPWDKYHAKIAEYATLMKRGVMSTEQQQDISVSEERCILALVNLMSQANNNNNKDALDELQSLYDYGVRPEFKQTLLCNAYAQAKNSPDCEEIMKMCADGGHVEAMQAAFEKLIKNKDASPEEIEDAYNRWQAGVKSGKEVHTQQNKKITRPHHTINNKGI